MNRPDYRFGAWLRIATLALAGLVLVAAGPDEIRDAERVLSERVGMLFASKTPVDRAWGAHLVGVHRIGEHVGAVRKALDATKGRSDVESRGVRISCLDALIRLGVTVPPGTVVPHYGTCPDEALLLLGRDPAGSRVALWALLEDEKDDLRWMTIVNLLAETRAPGLAYRLLREYEVKMTVHVLGPNTAIGIGGGGGGGKGGAAPMPPELPGKGWPPLRSHVLTDRAVRGATVVAPGRHPVYAVARAATGIGRTAPSKNRMGYREALFGQLLDRRTFYPEPFPWLTFTYESGEHFLERVRKKRESLKNEWELCLMYFENEGLITEEEKEGLKLRLRIEVKDFRWTKFPALPDLPKEWTEGED
jgi:8-oxo-dGTP pyrophosphatase MutT (NUDIX family)